MFNLKVLKNYKILKMVNRNNYIIRLVFFLIACFGIALNYNLFLVQFDIVVGGMSGLAIIIKHITGLSTTVFINVSSIVLLVLGYFFLGHKRIYQTLIGTISYLVMVTITAPLANSVNIMLNSDISLLLIITLINGVCSGIIYRAGFNTGGSDILVEIFSKYLKVSIGKSSLIINGTIIIFGALSFGLKNTMYAIFIIILSNKILDMVMLGINDSKLCFIKSSHASSIAKIIMEKLNVGVTEISSSGGVFTKKEYLLYVTVPFVRYYELKALVLKTDKNAFMLTHDCYTVSGGYKKKIIPF